MCIQYIAVLGALPCDQSVYRPSEEIFSTANTFPWHFMEFFLFGDPSVAALCRADGIFSTIWPMRSLVCVLFLLITSVSF